MENDDPGGVFEFSPSSRGPWFINASPHFTSNLPKCKNANLFHRCFSLFFLQTTKQEGEAVELHVVRAQGELLKQLVRYTVVPSGNSEFYGATGILEFKPGEREVLVALVARPDGEPEV